MNKLVLFLFLIWSSVNSAQDIDFESSGNQNSIASDTLLFYEEKVFEENFQSKYNQKDFIYETQVAEKGFWDRFKESMASFFRKILRMTDENASMDLVDFILKTLAVLLIIYVIYLIVKTIMNDEGSWIFGKSSDKKIITYEEIELNIHTVDFEKLIEDALKSNEKRVCIRYYHLWLLKKMADKNIIEWDAEKTNSEYSYEIQDPKLKEKFGYASYLYNYIWYGEFDLNDEAFTKVKSTFEKTIQSI